ncbi:CU044_5270 family protein [Actinomadura fulvescens]|uniref:CU044_5270 family protein n=1 Tax=Actinomadura fulvescens TaxID=46160 RepID=A0ABP6CLV1_9ACTN
MTRDVLRMLAEARPQELDPEARVDEATRNAELTRAMTAPPRSAGRSAGVLPARRRVRPMWGLGLVGAAAAAALVVATTATGPGSPEGKDGAQGTAVDPQNSRTVLLAAAQKAEQASDGRYWRVATAVGFPTQVGPKSRPYTVHRWRLLETWTARDGAGWMGMREVGAGPWSPGDVAAWKADGSPRKWDLGPMDTADRRHDILTTAPGRGSLIKLEGKERFRVRLAAGQLTLAEVRKLPADPRRLRAMAEKNALWDGPDGEIEADGPEARSAHAIESLVDLLTDVPATAKVRAAAFRALADMPAVRAQGRVKDDLGRSGVGFVYRWAADDFKLIIDPETARVLARGIKSSGGKNAQIKQKASIFLDSGWTNAKPQAPAVPPGMPPKRF